MTISTKMDKFFEHRKMLFVKHNNSLKLLLAFIKLSTNRYVKVLSYFLLVFHTSSFIWQIYLLSKIWENRLINQYSPCLLISFTGIFNISMSLSFEKELRKFMDLVENNFYSLDMAGEETRQRIARESKQIEYFLCINFLLVLTTCITEVHNEGFNQEHFLFTTYFKETFPTQAHVLNYSFYFLYLILYMYLLNGAYIVVYLSKQSIFQLYILQYCIFYMLGRTSNVCEKCIQFNENYQKKVFKRLKFCIKYQELLMRNGRVIIKISNKFLGVSVILLYILWVSALANIIWSPVTNYPYFICLAITLAVTGGMAAEIGDNVSEETTNLHYAFTNLPWYTWNQKNKKMFLFILIHVGKGIHVGPLKMFIVNRTLMIRWVKFLWSISSLIGKIRDT